MDRTVRIQLHPTSEQAVALQETLRQFTEAFNAVCAYGWQYGEKNGVKLHHGTYRSTKEAFPGLVSDLLIQARVKATEALKSAFTWKAKHEASYTKKVAKALKQGKSAPKFKSVTCPHSLSCAIRYNLHTYTLNWERHTVRLSTSAGKQSIPFTVPVYNAKYYGGTACTADLCYRKGTWWLHVVVNVPEPVVEKSEKVIGVDLGLNRPAVTSTRQFLGNRHWKEIDRRSFPSQEKTAIQRIEVCSTPLEEAEQTAEALPQGLRPSVEQAHCTKYYLWLYHCAGKPQQHSSDLQDGTRQTEQAC